MSAAAGAAAAAAIANAIKIFGKTSYKYLTSYKGLAFHTKSPDTISLPGDAEVVEAQRMWMPS